MSTPIFLTTIHLYISTFIFFNSNTAYLVRQLSETFNHTSNYYTKSDYSIWYGKCPFKICCFIVWNQVMISLFSKKKAKKLWSLFNASWQIAIFCTIAVVIINFFLWFLIKAALSIRFLEQSLIIKKKKKNQIGFNGSNIRLTRLIRIMCIER